MTKKPGYVLGAATDDALKALVDERLKELVAAAMEETKGGERAGLRAIMVLRKLANG